MYIVMRGIYKVFGVNCVLRGVDFELYEGEVYVLMGENGVGKFMLMNILIGFYKKDEG